MSSENIKSGGIPNFGSENLVESDIVSEGEGFENFGSENEELVENGLAEDIETFENFGSEDLIEKGIVQEGDKLDSHTLLRFASRILSWLALIFLTTVVIYAFSDKWGIPNVGKEIWDYSKVAISSLVGVIIGFYFARDN